MKTRLPGFTCHVAVNCLKKADWLLDHIEEELACMQIRYEGAMLLNELQEQERIAQRQQRLLEDLVERLSRLEQDRRVGQDPEYGAGQ